MMPVDVVPHSPRRSPRHHLKRIGRRSMPAGSASPHGKPLSPECGAAVFPLVVDVYDWLYRAPGRQAARQGAVRARRRRTQPLF